MAESTSSPSTSEYKILKFPVTKEKTVFYYYKQYTAKGTSKNGEEAPMVQLKEDRTLYVCHFLRPIQEEFVQRYFGLAGKIS